MSSNLAYSALVEAFFKFRSEADKIGFYTEELNRMEQSLDDLKPNYGTTGGETK